MTHKQYKSDKRNPWQELSYENERWIKSKNQIVKEHEWASDSIWPGYWRTNAKFPISYDYLTLKLLTNDESIEGRGRASNPCPNMTQTFGEENKMLLFYPYSSRTCHLRAGFFMLSNQPRTAWSPLRERAPNWPVTGYAFRILVPCSTGPVPNSLILAQGHLMFWKTRLTIALKLMHSVDRAQIIRK